MSLTWCALLLLVSGSLAEIHNKAWWNNTVFYQVYPRSLLDSNGDGVGDLPGITSKLSYFVESGVDAIWLSPIYKSPMIDFGYDISNFVDIDPIFGSLNDFKTLLARAKELGLRVVLDLVPNHTSDQHVWFQKALQGDEKYKNYYVWANGKNNDGVTPPNNWLSVFSGSAWQYVEPMNQWYFHAFDYRQPDLNYYNPDVREELINVLKFWLDLGIDGFRVDSAIFLYEDSELRDDPRSYAKGVTPRDYAYLDHIRTENQPLTYKLYGTWRQYLDRYSYEHDQDQKLLVMEAYASFKHTIEFYQYGVLPFNFEFISHLSSHSSALDYKNKIDLWITSLPVGEVANWVLGNHDNPRVASRYPGRLDQMTMLSMILPGMAVTYNGDEIGMVDKRDISWENTQDSQACNAGKATYATVSRDPERTPFQWDATKNAGFSTADSTWLPVNQNYKEVNLANEKTASESHYKIYTTLTQLHKTEPALTEGNYRSFTANNDTVLGIIRNFGSRFVLLLINFEDDKDQIVDLSGEGLPAQLTVKVSSLKSGVKAGTVVDVSEISLPAKAAVVYVSP